MRGAQWFLPGSEVNELRRRALESLLASGSSHAPSRAQKCRRLCWRRRPVLQSRKDMPSGSRMRRSCRGRPHRTRHGSLCRWPSGATCRRS